jgi:hypothetical protein
MRLILTLVMLCLALGAARTGQPFQAPAYQRPLLAYLDKVAPGSSVQVLQTAPLHLLVTIQGDQIQRRLLELDLRSLLSEFPQGSLLVVGARPPRKPIPQVLWLGVLIAPLLPHLLRARSTLDQGARKAAVILEAYPEFLPACLALLKSDQLQAIHVAQTSNLSYSERAKILSAFKAELAHSRSSDPQVAAQILERDYLSGIPGPQPIPNYLSKRAKTRRRLYSCQRCGEVFVDQESLRRHELGHPPRLHRRILLGAALLLLAAATHFWPSPSTHLALPGAGQLSPTQQAVLQECERLVPGLLVLQARNQLMLVCPAADMPRLQSILNQDSPGPLTIRPLAPITWAWLPGAELALGLLLLASSRSRLAHPME